MDTRVSCDTALWRDAMNGGSMSRACLLEGKPPYRFCVQDKESFRQVCYSAESHCGMGVTAITHFR